MSDKYPLSNKTNFQMACILFAIPTNFLLFVFSIFFTITMLVSQGRNLGYGILGIILFGVNTVSIFALMDYPEISNDKRSKN